MLGTDFRTGSPNWIDLGSPDTAAAAAFYEAVFSWRLTSAGPDSGGYGFFQKDGKTVGGLGPLTEEGAKSAWTTYFHSDDVEATARAVTEGQGSVRVEPMEVTGGGRLAQFTDPQGARFAVLRPGAPAGGLEAASEDNALVWVELHVADPEAAIRFYQGLFGWRSQDMEAPGMTYRVLSIRDGDQQEGSFGGVAALQGEYEEARWVPYFAVADADDTVTAVERNGGSVLMPAANVPEVGRIAWLTDPGQAVFAVLKPNPRQG
jgi:predicted enzyme related to lactoylglutathione lyase